MTETEFQKQVTDLAELFGWQWAHFRPAQTSRGWRTPVSGPLGKGWPDLFLTRRGKALAIELKVGKRKMTTEQWLVLDALAGAGIPAMVWYPEDFAEPIEDSLGYLALR